MPIELLVRHGCNICQGLHQLHSSGITMQDLKPVRPFVCPEACKFLVPAPVECLVALYFLSLMLLAGCDGGLQSFWYQYISALQTYPSQE